MGIEQNFYFRDWFDHEHIPYNLAFDNCTFSQVNKAKNNYADDNSRLITKNYRIICLLFVGEWEDLILAYCVTFKY